MVVIQKEKAPKVDNYKLRKERESERRKLNTAFKRCEENIEKTENLIAETQAEIENPENSADYEKIIELTAKLDELNNSLEQLYEDWENIQLKIAEYEE